MLTRAEVAGFERLWKAEENMWRVNILALEAHSKAQSIRGSIESALSAEFDEKISEFHAIKDVEDALEQA